MFLVVSLRLTVTDLRSRLIDWDWWDDVDYFKQQLPKLQASNCVSLQTSRTNLNSNKGTRLLINVLPNERLFWPLTWAPTKVCCRPQEFGTFLSRLFTITLAPLVSERSSKGNDSELSERTCGQKSDVAKLQEIAEPRSTIYSLEMIPPTDPLNQIRNIPKKIQAKAIQGHVRWLNLQKKKEKKIQISFFIICK